MAPVRSVAGVAHEASRTKLDWAAESEDFELFPSEFSATVVDGCYDAEKPSSPAVSKRSRRRHARQEQSRHNQLAHAAATRKQVQPDENKPLTVVERFGLTKKRETVKAVTLQDLGLCNAALSAAASPTAFQNALHSNRQALTPHNSQWGEYYAANAWGAPVSQVSPVSSAGGPVYPWFHDWSHDWSHAAVPVCHAASVHQVAAPDWAMHIPTTPHSCAPSVPVVHSAPLLSTTPDRADTPDPAAAFKTWFCAGTAEAAPLSAEAYAEMLLNETYHD